MLYEVLNGDQIMLLTYTVDNVNMFSFRLDRESTQYTLFVVGEDNPFTSTVDRETTTIKGTLIDDGNLTITVNQVIHDNERYQVDNYTYEMDLTFVLKTKDKLPQKPTDYKTLDTITEQDIDKLLGVTQ